MSEIIGNRYKLIKKLGGGGMANVYLALDTILNREVAIKILKSELASDRIALERFAREAKASACLTHQNIVETYDVGDYLDKHYIVMEYIKGYTLKKLIEIRGALPYKESIWIIKQLSYALLEAHTNGIIHRDVKSQNVLIKADGTIKMADFGIAQTMSDIQITSTDTIVGSVHYLAPEVTKGKSASMQSDIYSLGIVLYELLTGDVPFKGDSPVSIALQHVNKSIPSVRSKNPDIPQSVENIVIKACAKNLKNRYSNCAELINDLNNCLSSDYLNDQKIIFDSKQEGTINLDLFDEDEKDNKKASEKKATISITIIGIILVTLLSGVVVLGLLYLNGSFNKQVEVVTVSVPSLDKKTVIEAGDILESYGLVLDYSSIQRVLTDDVAEGLIISYEPSAGTKITKGSKVKIVVSSGVYSTFDNYIGKDFNEVKKILKSTKINATYNSVEKENGVPGQIVSQSVSQGFKYDPNETLNVVLEYVRFNTIEISIGSYKGKSIASVYELLESLSVSFEFIEKEKSYFTLDELEKYAAYTVVRIDPDEGSWYEQTSDSKIKIYYYTTVEDDKETLE